MYQKDKHYVDKDGRHVTKTILFGKPNAKTLDKINNFLYALSHSEHDPHQPGHGILTTYIDDGNVVIN